jgi:hypothetical protein
MCLAKPITTSLAMHPTLRILPQGWLNVVEMWMNMFSGYAWVVGFGVPPFLLHSSPLKNLSFFLHSWLIRIFAHTPMIVHVNL